MAMVHGLSTIGATLATPSGTNGSLRSVPVVVLHYNNKHNNLLFFNNWTLMFVFKDKYFSEHSVNSSVFCETNVSFVVTQRI